MDILNTVMGDMGEILRLLQGGTPTPEQVERMAAHNAAMLPTTIIVALGAWAWILGEFFLMRRQRRRGG